MMRAWAFVAVILAAFCQSVLSATIFLAATASLSPSSEKLHELHHKIQAARRDDTLLRVRPQLRQLAHMVRKLFALQRYDDDYSMQASVHTAYQILRRTGVEESDIVLMSPDTVAGLRKVCNEKWAAGPGRRDVVVDALKSEPGLARFVSSSTPGAASDLWREYVELAKASLSLGCELVPGHIPQLTHYPDGAFNMRTGLCRRSARNPANCGGYGVNLDFGGLAASQAMFEAVVSGDKTKAEQLCAELAKQPEGDTRTACTGNVLSNAKDVFVFVAGREALGGDSDGGAGGAGLGFEMAPLQRVAKSADSVLSFSALSGMLDAVGASPTRRVLAFVDLTAAAGKPTDYQQALGGTHFAAVLGITLQKPGLFCSHTHCSLPRAHRDLYNGVRTATHFSSAWLSELFKSNCAAKSSAVSLHVSAVSKMAKAFAFAGQEDGFSIIKLGDETLQSRPLGDFIPRPTCNDVSQICGRYEKTQCWGPDPGMLPPGNRKDTLAVFNDFVASSKDPSQTATIGKIGESEHVLTYRGTPWKVTWTAGPHTIHEPLRFTSVNPTVGGKVRLSDGSEFINPQFPTHHVRNSASTPSKFEFHKNRLWPLSLSSQAVGNSESAIDFLEPVASWTKSCVSGTRTMFDCQWIGPDIELARSALLLAAASDIVWSFKTEWIVKGSSKASTTSSLGHLLNDGDTCTGPDLSALTNDQHWVLRQQETAKKTSNSFFASAPPMDDFYKSSLLSEIKYKCLLGKSTWDGSKLDFSTDPLKYFETHKTSKWTYKALESITKHIEWLRCLTVSTEECAAKTCDILGYTKHNDGERTELLDHFGHLQAMSNTVFNGRNEQHEWKHCKRKKLQNTPVWTFTMNRGLIADEDKRSAVVSTELEGDSLQLRVKDKLYPVKWIGAKGDVAKNLKITSVAGKMGGVVVLSDGRKFRNPGRGSWKRSERSDRWISPSTLCMGIYPWLASIRPKSSVCEIRTKETRILHGTNNLPLAAPPIIPRGPRLPDPP